MTKEYSLPRCTPESQGIASGDILKFVNAVEKEIDELHSFMVLRHGTVVAVGWWEPYGATIPHMLFSLTKSFTSSAIGLAVAEKRLTVEDRVLDFFPDDAPKSVSKNLAAMQVRHLLGMSTGHAVDTMPLLFKRRDGNWTRAFLAQPVKHKPGTHFLYNTGASYMLSAIVQKVTGMTLLDYLEPRLLAPLGIKNATSEMSPQGICMGGFGMSMTTEDIARFGQLYLQKGMWNGKQLLPESWVAQATSKQTDNRGWTDNPDWVQGYGYQFWRCRHDAYRGDGAFGQFCVVMPKQDMVVAITSGVADMQPVLDQVWKYLLPAAGASMPDNAKEHKKLTDKLGKLAYSPPQGKVSSPTAKAVSGKTYTVEPNPLKIKTLAFDFSESESRITIGQAKEKYEIVCGAGEWRKGTSMLLPNYPKALASGVWKDNDTFDATIRYYETPFIHTLSCRFGESTLGAKITVNVGFDTTPVMLTGKMR